MYICLDELKQEELLKRFLVGDVWDIGPACEETLHEKSIVCAAGFRALPDSWIRSEMTAQSLRTARELRGKSCLDLELVRPEGSPTDRKTLL